jgi:hypothetical protein
MATILKYAVLVNDVLPLFGMRECKLKSKQKINKSIEINIVIFKQYILV